MLVRLALYLLLAGDGRGIVVAPAAGPEEGCPSPRQVTDALAARLPGTVAQPGAAANASLLRLAVTPDPGGGVRVDLSDPAGTPLLHRLLPPAPRPRPGDCGVLADTVALIVERYWREVGYDVPANQPPPPTASPPPAPAPTPPPPHPTAPPAPPPAPAVHPLPPAVSGRRPAGVATQAGTVSQPLAAWSLGAALAGRTDTSGDMDPTVQVALATERHLGRVGLGLRLTGGVGRDTTLTILGGHADVRRYPLRIGGYLPINTAFGRLEPGIGFGVDLMTVDNHVSPAGTPETPRSGVLCSPSVCASPGADASIGWSIFWDQHVYLRASLRGGLTAPFHFITYDSMTNGKESIWSTPRTYLEVALESGVWFP